MGGDGIVDLLHGEMWQLEDIAIKVEMLAFLPLSWDLSSHLHGLFSWRRARTKQKGGGRLLVEWCGELKKG